MVNSPYQIYRQSSVQTANGGKLIIMLYEGAIRFTKLGIDAVHNRKYDAANNNFLKAQAIINELIAALNFDYPISNDLVKIYEYMLHSLIQANMKKNATIAEEVVTHLMDLLESWKQASNGAAGNHQAAADSV